MNTHIDGSSGLVSSPSDREIQGTSAFGIATAPVSNVSASSWYKSHVAKRDVGQINNRTLIDPSASESRISAYLGKKTGRVLEWDPVCLCVQKRCMNLHVGIVLGEPLQIGLTSCRDGNRICSPLGQVGRQYICS